MDHESTHNGSSNPYDSWMYDEINKLLSSTLNVWKNMYDLHVLPIKTIYNVNVTKPREASVTRYVDYVKKIRDFQIRLPDWFLLSNGTDQQKITPFYENTVDCLPVALVDTRYPKSKTLFMCHTSCTMTRNGMQVSDNVTRNIIRGLGSMYFLFYIRSFSVSPESCFFITDNFAAYYEHIKYALLTKDLKRMVLLSSRQIFMMVEIIRDMRSMLIDELSLIDPERADECGQILSDKKNVSLKKLFCRLWPELDVIVLLMDANYRVYTNKIKHYVGDTTLYSPIYYTSEATIGYCMDPSTPNRYIIDSRKAYFEFVHVNGKRIDGSKLVNIRNLQIGELYNIVVSTTSTGFMRCVTDDVVKVVGYFNGAPEIEPVCRMSDLIAVDSQKEKTITPNTLLGVLLKDLDVVDFCWRRDNNKINIYVELPESAYLSDVTNTYDVKDDVKSVDVIDTLFDDLGLDAVVKIVKPKTFDELCKSRYSEYVDPGLVQIPRHITRQTDTEILKRSILYVF